MKATASLILVSGLGAFLSRNLEAGPPIVVHERFEIVEIASTQPSQLPLGMAFGPDSGGFTGDLHVAMKDGVRVLSLSDLKFSDFATGLNSGVGLAFNRGDPSDPFGEISLFVLDNDRQIPGKGFIYRYDSAGNRTTFDTLSSAVARVDLRDIAFGPGLNGFSRNLFVTDSAFGGLNLGDIHEYDPAGVRRDPPFFLSAEFRTASGLAFASGGVFGEAALVAAAVGGNADDNGGIWKFPADPSPCQDFRNCRLISASAALDPEGQDTDLYDPTDVLQGPGGGSEFGTDLFITDWSKKKIYTFAPGGLLREFAVGFSFLSWEDANIAFSPDGTSLFASDAGAKKIYRISPLTLDLDIDASFTLTPERRSAVYKASVKAGYALVLELEDADPLDANALYVGWGAPPTPALFDHAAENRFQAGQRLVVPFTRSEPCYIRIQANVLGGGQNQVTLRGRIQKLALEDFSTRSSGPGGTGVLSGSVNGAGFGPNTSFRLSPAAGGDPIPAAIAEVVSSSRAELQFSLSGSPEGDYDLIASDPIHEEQRLLRAFQVLPAGRGAVLEVKLQGSRFYRADRIARMTLSYANLGEEEMAAPLVQVSGPPGSELRLVPESEFHGSAIQVLCIDPVGVAGKLPPGAKGEIPILYRIEDPGVDGAVLDFRASSFHPGPDDAVDWSRLPRPPGMSEDDWARAWPALSVNLGGTWRDYHQGLARTATRLARRGAYAPSVLELFRFEVREVLERPSSAVVGVLRLKETGAPLEGFTIAALQAGEVKSRTATLEEGRFALDWLQAGNTYEIRIPDFDLGMSGVTIPLSGDVLALELEAIPCGAPPSSGCGKIPPGCENCSDAGLPLEPLDLPPALLSLRTEKGSSVISSEDPNTKEGSPDGEGDQRLILGTEPLAFKVKFQNVGSSPAQTVKIKDSLHRNLDPTTVEFIDFQVGARADQYLLFSGTVRLLPGGGSARACGMGYACEPVPDLLIHDVPGESEPFTDVPVSFIASVDPSTGIVTWDLRTILRDPYDTYTGFLPPDASGTRDEAFVTFRVTPVPGLEEGAEITNDAQIEFDENGIVHSTGQVTYHISKFRPPSQALNPYPESGGRWSLSRDFALSWEIAPGAKTYDVFLWLDGTSRPDLPTASGLPGASYGPSGLLPSEAYRWQVAAVNDNGSTLSEEWTFVTEGPPPPCPQRPLAPFPEDGAVGVEETVQLQWQGEADPLVPVLYRVSLWKKGEAPRAIVDGLTAALTPAITLKSFAEYEWQVTAYNSGCGGGGAVGPVWSFRTQAGAFLRGDSNGEGELDLSDAVHILLYLFLAGLPPPCRESADFDDDGSVEVTDAISLLEFLFIDGLPPGEPYPACGADPNPDRLGCIEYRACR